MKRSTHRDLAQTVARALEEPSSLGQMARILRKAVRPEHRWIVHAFSQPWRGHTTDTDVVLYYLLRLLVSQQLDICTIGLDGQAGRDEERDRHQGVLDRGMVSYGLSAAVDREQRNADHDGYLIAHQELSGMRVVTQPHSEEKFREFFETFARIDGQRLGCDVPNSRLAKRWAPRYEVRLVPVLLGQPPTPIPLEIGFCDPSRVLFHLIRSGYVARWPRDSKSLHIIATADDPYVALRMEGRTSLPGYEPWKFGKVDVGEALDTSRRSHSDHGLPEFRQELASMITSVVDWQRFWEAEPWRAR